ncbi:hypothetical protein Mal4_08010 [Maioricimonas rarisocia]|uniref:TRASH domain-containing protein n=1 Tax=Maioricimonas rarisocia TaxID=2528026 RepID=A0A517Z223_9PLAN|nr:hypothetical protein [Maioricimonas rarisocia]QDU36515.1 hypothetical protein Mal4_08010 [Maioricimonas rarisocia]
MKKLAAILLAGVILSIGLVNVQAEEEKAKPEVKCPVSGRPIDKEHSVAFKKAEVYFCCPNCPAAFKENKGKFAAKANHQLVLTEQAKPTGKCPLTGRPVDESKQVDVAGVEVSFCCGNCQGKAAKATGDEQITLVFANKAFNKGFEVPKKEKKADE